MDVRAWIMKAKKNWYYIIAALVVLTLFMSMTMCGDKTSDEESSNGDVSTTSSQKNNTDIKVEDIVWTIEEGIQGGKRVPIFEYTNNSDFTITYLSINLKVKEEVTDKDFGDYLRKQEYYADAVKDYKKYWLEDENASEKEISNGFIAYMRDHSVTAESEDMLKPGEISRKERPKSLRYYYDMIDMSEYELVRPDIMTIKYIRDDGKVYTMYYDYASKNYSMESNVGVERDTYNWPEELIDILPEPQFEEIEIDEYDDKFFIKTDEALLDEVKAYVEECKEKGFTIDEYSFSNDTNVTFRAKNESGLELSIWIGNYTTNITIDRPESKETEDGETEKLTEPEIESEVEPEPVKEVATDNNKQSEEPKAEMPQDSTPSPSTAVSNDNSKVIIGSSPSNVRKLLSKYKETPSLMGANALDFEDNNLLITVYFDKNNVAEGVIFLSNNMDTWDTLTGSGSYVSKHYDELVALATDDKNVKVESDFTKYNSSGVKKYPAELYIGKVAGM